MVAAARWSVAIGLCVAACAPPKRLFLPAEMRPQPKAEASADAKPTSTPGVMRVAESGRVWEFELPRDAGSFDMRVPLTRGANSGMLTEADREVLSKQAEQPTGAIDARTAAAQQSLLMGLAKVTDLYRDRRYELALIEAVELEKAYPGEARVHAMKGSLYRHLGKAALSRTSFQRALELDPSNLAVAEALREITDSRE